MNSRDKILAELRSHRHPFPDAAPRPDDYIPVTRFNDEDRLVRFTAELQARHGQVHVAANQESAIDTVLSLLEADKRVMAWDGLPLPGLVEAITARQIDILHLRARDAERVPALEDAETIRVGITGADAAFATLGTIALVTAKGHGRVVSLLPPVHIALLPLARLFERPEDWFIEEGREALRKSRSVAFVTGPSSTGDIEHHTVFGAHGPGAVHIVMF